MKKAETVKSLIAKAEQECKEVLKNAEEFLKGIKKYLKID